MTAPPRWVDADRLRAQVSPDAAREALRRLLVEGFDTAADVPRSVVPADAGHLLLMPSGSGRAVGVKVASVAPGNPARGLPRIQALYVLFDADTLTPRLLVDGAALTSLRTPAVSALAADVLAPPDAAHLVLFGTGPQARGHLQALTRVRPLSRVSVVGRREQPVREVCEEAQAAGLRAAPAGPDAVADADLVVCATSAGEPLFDGDAVPSRACVLAVGSHQPDRRELDAALLARAQVVVEDPATALREAGDVVLAQAENALAATDLVPLAGVVRGTVPVATDRVRVFKGTGMAWQDVAVAALLADDAGVSTAGGGVDDCR